MNCSYEASSDGYNPAEKREELFHVNARFVCAHTQDTTPRLAGFAIWRFDMDGEDEVEVPVVYWCAQLTSSSVDLTLTSRSYEVQVAAEVAGKGIGRRLMDVLALMAKAYNLDKVVLTVFKGVSLCFPGSLINVSCSQRAGDGVLSQARVRGQRAASDSRAER